MASLAGGGREKRPPLPARTASAGREGTAFPPVALSAPHEGGRGAGRSSFRHRRARDPAGRRWTPAERPSRPARAAGGRRERAGYSQGSPSARRERRGGARRGLRFPRCGREPMGRRQMQAGMPRLPPWVADGGRERTAPSPGAASAPRAGPHRRAGRTPGFPRCARSSAGSRWRGEERPPPPNRTVSGGRGNAPSPRTQAAGGGR